MEQGDTRTSAQSADIQRVVTALVEAEDDKEKDDTVKSQLSTSIYTIGIKYSGIAIPTLLSYRNHAHVGRQQNMLVLTMVSNIIDHSDLVAKLDQGLAVEVIKAAVDSLQHKETVQVGSDILVTMSKTSCVEIMKQMLTLFQPGSLPTVTTFHTFGRIFAANVYDSIPFLSAALSMLVPLLSEVKHDAVRRAICGAVSQFAEALLEYVANANEAPDPAVKVSLYQADFNAIFEHILVHWMPKAKDAELASYMVHAVSSIAKVVSKEKLQEQAERLLSSAATIVRRHPHEPNATAGLAVVLEILSSHAKATLEPQVDSLVDVIFTQACTPPDYSKPFAVKSHNEVLRCFAILYLNFPDKIINFLFGKLSPNVLKSAVSKDATDRTVVAALTILNKLVNQQDVSFAFYVQPLFKALEPVVSPTPIVQLSNNIKQTVAQLILTLADRQYLNLENGGQFIEFIIRQCSIPATTIPRSPSGLESITDEALRASCENVLHLLATTVHGMEKVLLPSLFNFLVLWPYTESVRTTARCLCHLNTKQDIFATLSSENPGKHPSVVQLFTRLFTLAGFIMDKPDGEAVLKLLQLVMGKMFEAVTEARDGVSQELEGFVKQSLEAQVTWDPRVWEETLLKMLDTSLKDIKNVDPGLVHQITESFTQQISSYMEFPEEKSFLYVALGISLSNTADPLTVNKALDGIFSTINHARLSERQACATAIGRTSSTHFDLILSKLDAFSAKDTHGKRSSFFNIFSSKEKRDETHDSERIKATLVLCYAHVIGDAPRALLVTRIDDIMRSVIPFFVGAKDFATKHALCRLSEMVAKALKETGLPLEKRLNLMFNMKDFVKSEPAELRSSVRALAITACSELATLPPKIPMEELEDALLLFCNNVFPLLPPKDGSRQNLQIDTGNNAYLNYEVLWEATVSALTEFVITVVKVYRSSDAMLAVIKNLKPWLESDSDHERYHSLQMLNKVFMSDAMTENVLVPVSGLTAGLLATRAMDPDARCRETALSCGGRMAAVVSLNKHGDQGWTEAASTSWLKESLTSQAYANSVASLFYRFLEGEQLLKFVRHSYYQGLLDKRTVTATGIGLILQATLRNKWGPLKDYAAEIVTALLYAMKYVKDTSTKVVVEGCVRAVAEHDTSMVAQVLLNQPVPLHPSTADLWRSLGSSPTFSSVLLIYCVEVLRATPVYSEIHTHVRCVNLPVLQSLAVLTELFQASGNVELLQANFADIVPTLIVTTAAMVGAQSPKPPFAAISSENSAVDAEWKQVYKVIPSRLAVDCLKQLLKNTNSVVPISFEMMEDASMYAEGIHVTSKCIFQSSEVDTGKIISTLAPYLESEIDAQRAAVVAVYSAMLESKKPANPAEVNAVVNYLTGKNSDQALIVRVFCIRGVGSLALFGSKMVNANTDGMLRVILAGLEDTSDGSVNSAPVEAMKSLNKILPVIDRNLIQDSLISFAMRLRPSFESDNPMFRAMAFALFGQIAAVAEKEDVKEAFVQEVHNNLVILLLHLNDEHVEVSVSTKAVFRLLLPLLKSGGLNHAFNFPDGIPYGRLLRLICDTLGTEHPTKIPNYLNVVLAYFRSENPTTRANAALLAGHLLAQISKLNDSQIIPSHISPALIAMLNDREASVRQRAAEALGLMY